MKILIWSMTLAVIVTLVFMFMVGSGGFRRATTLTGWYAVEGVGDYDVVCFHLKNSEVGNCLPKSQIERKP